MALNNSPEQAEGGKLIKKGDREALIAELRQRDPKSVIMNDGGSIVTVSDLLWHLEHRTHEGNWYLMLHKCQGKRRINNPQQTAEEHPEAPPVKGVRGAVKRLLSYFEVIGF